MKCSIIFKTGNGIFKILLIAEEMFSFDHLLLPILDMLYLNKIYETKNIR